MRFSLLSSLFRVFTRSRPQRPHSFWSAPAIVTSGQVQRHSGFEWLCKHNRLIREPIRFVRLDSEQAQSDGKSVNHWVHDSWCWQKGAQPLGTRMRIYRGRCFLCCFSKPLKRHGIHKAKNHDRVIGIPRNYRVLSLEGLWTYFNLSSAVQAAEIFYDQLTVYIFQK